MIPMHNVSDIMKIRETARIAKAAKVEAAFGSWPAESLIQAAKVVGNSWAVDEIATKHWEVGMYYMSYEVCLMIYIYDYHDV